MKYLLWVLATAAVLAALVGLSGFLVPARYEASASLRVEAPPEAIWNVLAASEDYPAWRSDVGVVERIGTAADMIWRETDGHGGVMRHDASAGRHPDKFIDRFETLGAPGNRGVPAGVAAARGQRVLLLVSDAQGKTRVAITETGEIPGVLARFRARFMTGYDKGVRRLAEDLQGRLADHGG